MGFELGISRHLVVLAAVSVAALAAGRAGGSPPHHADRPQLPPTIVDTAPTARRSLDPARLRREVAGSRRWLRRAFGVPADFFAYPAGRYDRAVEAAVRAAGYLGETTTQPGEATRADDAYALPRVRVTPEMGPAELLALLRGPART